MNKISTVLAGLFVGLGILAAGYFMANAVLDFKRMDRTVSAKGLAEMEVPADIAIFPIKFSVGSDDLNNLYSQIKNQSAIIKQFLATNNFTDEEISSSAPVIIDKASQQYGGQYQGFRYTADTTINVYTSKVDSVINARKNLLELASKGIVVSGDGYQAQTEYIFTGLNDIKPKMIEEATKNARTVAEKFAQDSNSKIGKLRTAQQGQFSIYARDSNTPHIKKIRVVSTLEYYLVD